MPIRGLAELAGQAQATVSGRHVTGVPVPVVSSLDQCLASGYVYFFLIGAVHYLEPWGYVDSRQA